MQGREEPLHCKMPTCIKGTEKEAVLNSSASKGFRRVAGEEK